MEIPDMHLAVRGSNRLILGDCRWLRQKKRVAGSGDGIERRRGLGSDRIEGCDPEAGNRV